MAAGLELNLPDLPEVPIRLGADGPDGVVPRPARPLKPAWSVRLRETLTAYLPLLLMVGLALGTWWLVRQAPSAEPARAKAVLRGEPDYTLRGFTLERFAADGRLRVTLDGQQLHHFPEDDRIEIEALRLRLSDAQGRPVEATAHQANTDGRASDIRLLGGAQLRGWTSDGQPLTLESETLHVGTEPLRVHTDRPVTVRAGQSTLQAGGLVWDGAARVLELRPPIRAVLEVGRRPAR
jgi:lipopolysaccharide export system protein LptC